MPKRIDMMGQQFERLTVISELPPKGKDRRFLCRCECEKEIPVMMMSLRSGHTRSCGCLKSRVIHDPEYYRQISRLKYQKRIAADPEYDKKRSMLYYEHVVKPKKLEDKQKLINKMNRKKVDLTGKKFGFLKVVELSKKQDDHGNFLWKCKCVCKKNIYLAGISLRYGHYTSCGCKHAEKRDAGLANHISQDAVDGTRKSALIAKIHKHNKSGHKGVRWNQQRQKWTAHIGFQGKQISLGYHIKKEDAIAARIAGEEKYHKPYLKENSLSNLE
jgi:hypothetical protein